LSEATLTPRRLTTDAAASLAAAGVDSPVLDAQLLLAGALGVTRERLLLDHDDPVSDDAAVRFRALLARRMKREPVAYILGNKHFRWITLDVDRRVLIPRPETELLVEIGLALPTGSRVVDVGTGSGAIALALAFERPDLEVWGTDVSSDALDVARGNAERLGLRVRFVAGDLLDGVDRPIEAVLANPPYVIEGIELGPEISRYEPHVALFAGSDGLDVIRRLVAAAEDVPFLAVEIGWEQAPEVTELMRAGGFRRTEVYRDLAGHERAVVGRR
jgi:release factor glutamine methyltransferase